ncbi:MAG TPA: hypothetical protein VIG05_02070 [Candidatus Nitrosotenuis sp.]
MSDDKLWTVTVTIALSSLLILAYFVLHPITAKEGTVEQTKMRLDTAINKIETLRGESKQVSTQSDSSLNP